MSCGRAWPETYSMVASMDDEELKEYEKALGEQKLGIVFSKCLLLQAGLVVPAFMLGRAYETREVAFWPSLFWLFIMIMASAGILNMVIKSFRFKPE